MLTLVVSSPCRAHPIQDGSSGARGRELALGVVYGVAGDMFAHRSAGAGV